MNKDEKLQITKDQLIDAIFSLMEEKEDPLQVTSREIAARIPGSELVMVPGLGHGLYEEDPEFLKRVIAFCQ